MGRHGWTIALANSGVPSGKLLHNYRKSPFLMGKSPFIVDFPMKHVIFHSYVSLPEGTVHIPLVGEFFCTNWIFPLWGSSNFGEFIFLFS
jgi:hypothetical protein